MPTILIANAPERYQDFALPTFTDVLPERGSLGGIYTALVRSQTPYTLCVACDMPFLNVDLLRYLLDCRDGADAVAPVLNGEIQGLHAVYGQTCIAPMQACLARGEWRVQDFFAHVQTRFVTPTEIERFDPLFRSFMNLNTPDELAHASAELS
jgi:molybdopterin-guanine dinucleotide biosynthesis protein A